MCVRMDGEENSLTSRGGRMRENTKESERNDLKGEREERHVFSFSLLILPFSFLLRLVPVLEWFDPSFSSFPSTFTLVLLVFFFLLVSSFSLFLSVVSFLSFFQWFLSSLSSSGFFSLLLFLLRYFVLKCRLLLLL